MQAALAEEFLQQVAYALVVVDDENVRVGFHPGPANGTCAATVNAAAFRAYFRLPRGPGERGNNAETKFNNPEKQAKEINGITPITAIRRAVAGDAPGFQEPVMRGFSFGLMVIGVSLAVVVAGQSDAKAGMTRSERCTRLSRQVDEAIETHAKAMQVAEARGLQKKANRYCAEKKQAQGIRMLADALKLLGVTPTDPGP